MHRIKSRPVGGRLVHKILIIKRLVVWRFLGKKDGRTIFYYKMLSSNIMTQKNVFFHKIFGITQFLFLPLIFVNCHQSTFEPVTYQNVAIELCPYFQQFEIEAAARGLNIDLKIANISGDIISIQNGEVGVCADIDEKQIFIDQDFWERSSDLTKEFIVFHELGHCFLKRKHLNTVAENGTCLSIMRRGNGSCLDYYTSKTRTALLDELFK